MDAAHTALEALADARRRTFAAATARIELRVDLDWAMPPLVRPRRGGLLTPAVAAGKAAGKRLLGIASGGVDFRHMSAEGVIDIAGRRSMLDYGGAARLYADGREWDGASGCPLATLPSDKPQMPTPLWLLDVLVGVTAATDMPSETVRGARCRRVAATADLSVASRAAPGGLATPERERFEELLALPVGIWLDDEHIRRVRFTWGHRTDTLELWDFGVPLDDVDWTRLPTFRTPGSPPR